jgi:large subunit ribosomal protein L6
MSRIGKLPIALPAGVSVQAKERHVTVKGPKGSLEIDLRPEIDVEIDEKELRVTPNGSGPARESRAFHGMTRALLNNMVKGVTEGYRQTLEILGVGWNASGKGKQLTLNIGFCHPVILEVPEGLEVQTPSPNQIDVEGIDKQKVGQFAAVIRAVRPPEPYKGKGIRYRGEFVRRKVGKSFGS